MPFPGYYFLFYMLLLCVGQAGAAELRVAVASNFFLPMQQIVSAYEQQSENTIKLSIGSSGKHYAQLQNGAPFDMLFSADSNKVYLLEQQKLIIPGTRFTYAIGRLALVSMEPENEAGAELGVLTQRAGRIAIANPMLAPYGRAAQQTLQQAGLWEQLQPRLVVGENASQTLQFVASRNARFGFVAASYLSMPELSFAFVWPVPDSMHEPIVQQAGILRDSPAARDFARFVSGESGRAVITRYGYHLP
ncbi:MAG: molybdate transport system substrate-binding protein [Gammaproteobacteria bacterium]|jgi:molybdate transport system substrate-binding protein|tara:strand:- start:3369 stop:4112 length:744 start_codon:yes stop_codon:yes gene_type:complete